MSMLIEVILIFLYINITLIILAKERQSHLADNLHLQSSDFERAQQGPNMRVVRACLSLVIFIRSGWPQRSSARKNGTTHAMMTKAVHEMMYVIKT